MATVYLAEDLKHRRRVAIKVLNPELARALGSERFLREVEVTANLTHPHILPLHDSGEADGFLYYVMPYIEGETLRDRLNREGQLPVYDALQITKEVAAALSYAHSQGLIHRDIKPENVLLSAGEAVVADFGIARAVSAAGGERLTETGLAVGTPAYMSPEQAAGESEVDARSDLYSLGCVLYEMLAGDAPYTASTPQALIAKKLAEPTPRISVVRESVHPAVETALAKALAKTPADRFLTAQEFAEALTAEMVVARVVTARWLRPVAASAGVVVVLLAVWGLFTLGGGPAYERLAVLPPTNLMNDPDQEYFVAAMHNALITELQQAGVAVIARTSVMQYENIQKPIREIASELGVGALVEASVLRVGDSVEVEIKLVDGTTQQYVADPIVRRSDLRDIERLYRGLTAAIASEIRAALTPQAEAHLASARPVNPQAYDVGLKGLAHVRRATPSDLDQALEYFQEALLLDSTYALPHVGTAMVWVGRGAFGLTTPREAAAHASVAVQQALELDSTHVEVQSAVALIRLMEWDWAGAEAAYLKIFEINRGFSGARQGYALLLAWMGRLEEARVQLDRALALDPYNPGPRMNNGDLLAYEGRYAEAIEELQAARRIQPDHPGPYRGLASVYHMLGSYDEALEALRRWFPGDRELEEALDRGYAEGSYRTALVRYAETLASRPQAAERVSWIIASMYAWAGEKERTLEWLELAYRAHHPMLPYANSPDFEVVHDDPRYHDLRRRMGLPQ
jgi:serine/threonine-protein kinase